MIRFLATQSFGFVKYFCEQHSEGTKTNSLAFYDYLKRVVCFSTRNVGEPDIKFWQTAHSSFALKKPCYIMSLSDQPDITIAQPASCFHTDVGQSSYLWLSGQLLPETIKLMTKETGISSQSDAEHLLYYMILRGNVSIIKEPIGAIMYHMGNLYSFTNQEGLLYTDELMSISTEKFDDCIPVKPGMIFQYNYISETTKIESVF